MSCSKPLAYDSLKSVLLRMDPNLRIRLFDRVPGIQTAERSVPLYIEKLYLDRFTTCINEGQYSVCCMLQNPLILADWQRNKLSMLIGQPLGCDLTCYGIRNYSVDDEISPGDVVLPKTESDEIEREQDEEDLNLLNQMVTTETDTSASSRMVVSFHLSLQGDIILDEQLDYSRSLADAMKYLNKKLFGGRHHGIRVYWFYDGFGVLRLPADFRLTTKIWTITNNIEEVYSAYRDIMYEKSFPLKLLRFEGYGDYFSRSDNYQHPIVQSAGELFVFPEYGIENETEVVLGVKNSNFHFECALSMDTIKTAVESWIRNGKDIGSCFSFVVKKEADLKSLIEDLKKQKNAKTEQVIMLGSSTFPDIIIIPLENGSEVMIWCIDPDEKDEDHLDRWQLIIAFTEKGHYPFWDINFDNDVFE